MSTTIVHRNSFSGKVYIYFTLRRDNTAKKKKKKIKKKKKEDKSEPKSHRSCMANYTLSTIYKIQT